MGKNIQTNIQKNLADYTKRIDAETLRKHVLAH